MWRIGLASAVLIGIGCGSSGGDANQPPVAALAADSTLKVKGYPFEFDASGSSDPDGTIVHYRYVFADGTPAIATAGSATTHAYPRTGVYTVQLTVVDDDGAEASATLTVTVVEAECEAPEECDAPLACVDGLCQCPNRGPLCGEICCNEGETCQGGVCMVEGCQPPLAMCGNACVDLEYDENNCGACGRVCYACELGECRGECPFGQTYCDPFGCYDLSYDPLNCGACGFVCPSGVCFQGRCVDNVCPPGWELCDGVNCYDLSSDPFNCGFCFNFCESFECRDFMCTTTMGGDPGTVLEVFPPPPYLRITGMTYQFGTFYLMTGRRFVMFDPFSGIELGNWFIEEEATRRATGLAADPFGSFLYTGSCDRFDPFSPCDLEGYLPFDTFASHDFPGRGGPIALEESTGFYWVFDNLSQELVQLGAFMTPPTELARFRVEGLDFTDRFTDLADDGYGSLWAVRPDLDGPLGPRMVKISLSELRVILDVTPPDPDGIGGVVLAEGALWGAGRNGVYRMVP